jgi:Uma2 family endonuclease
MTEAEYLASEPDAEVRHEYIAGRVYAMAGATTNHNRITANVLGELRNHLKGIPCEAFASDMRAKVTKDYYYPDVVVVCNHIEEKGITSAPMIIVEVLSQSTRKRDLTTKLLQYINLPSLQEYVLIEQDIVRIQVLRKRTDWKPEEYSLGDSIAFESINLTLPIEEIYDRVDNKEINEFRQTKFV